MFKYTEKEIAKQKEEKRQKWETECLKELMKFNALAYGLDKKDKK